MLNRRKKLQKKSLKYKTGIEFLKILNNLYGMISDSVFKCNSIISIEKLCDRWIVIVDGRCQFVQVHCDATQETSHRFNHKPYLKDYLVEEKGKQSMGNTLEYTHSPFVSRQVDINS